MMIYEKNMMCKAVSLSFFLACLFWSACNRQSEAFRLLREAQVGMETSPEEAMNKIDSIFYPQTNLSKEQYMQYLVTQVQARHKTYRSLKNDTLVFVARDYFIRRKKFRQAALACFYSGCVYKERNDFEPAVRQYELAREYALKTDEAALQGLILYHIGDLFYEEGSYAEAISAYREAAQKYEGDLQKRIRCFGAMGRTWMLQEQNDSAFYYLREGWNMAMKSSDSLSQSLLAQNLGVAYAEVEAYERALYYQRRSFHLNTDTSKVSRYYLSFAEIYLQMGNVDSAAFYTRKLKKEVSSVGNLKLRTSICHFLFDEALRRADYESALDYQQQECELMEEITQQRAEQLLTEVQRRYNFERLQSKHQSQLNRYQQWSIFLLFLLCISGAAFAVYVIQKKNSIVRMYKQIDLLQKMSKEMTSVYETNLRKKEADLRQELLWKMDVVAKASLLDEEVVKNMPAKLLLKQFRQIVYDKNEDDRWSNILSVFSRLNPNFSTTLRNTYPCLNETEYRICLLSYAGMNVREIALFLRLSPNTVQAYRTKLRRRIGICDSSIDTATFLRDNLPL